MGNGWTWPHSERPRDFQNVTYATVEIVRSDNENVFKNKALAQLCRDRDIRQGSTILILRSTDLGDRAPISLFELPAELHFRTHQTFIGLLCGPLGMRGRVTP